MESVARFWLRNTMGLQYTRSSNTVIIFTKYGELHVNNPKEKFPVSKYDYLLYEDNETIKQFTGSDGSGNHPLNDTEINSIRNWIKYFYDGENYPDISLACYDPKDANLYKGMLPISECIKKGYTYVKESCDYPVARYDEESHTWLKIKAIIREDGTYTVDPDKYCDLCIMFLTEDEWNKMPPFPKNITPDQEYYIRWDFATSTWKDIRTIDYMKKQYEDLILQRFDYLKNENLKYYLNTVGTDTVDILSVMGLIPKDVLPTTADTNALAQAGAEDVLEYLSIGKNRRAKLQARNDFTVEELIRMYTASKEFLNGQMFTWLQAPEVLTDSQDYEGLTTVQGWQNLITDFNEWYTRIYISSTSDK